MTEEDFISLVMRMREYGVARFKYGEYEVEFRRDAWSPTAAIENILSVDDDRDSFERENKSLFESLAYHSS